MYQLSKLLKHSELFHAFSTVEEGNMANSILGEKYDFEKTIENRKRFLKKVGVPIENCIALWVLGGNGVGVANVKDAGVSMLDYQKAVKTDALLTDKKGLFLMLLTADCLPVIVYDPKKMVVGVVHAGWSGVNLNIAGETVNKLKEIYKTDPRNLLVSFGPAAQNKSFIKENPSQKDDEMWKGYINKVGDNMYSVDFVGLCTQQFIDCGVSKKNIIDCGADTVTDERFFSHYRDKEKPKKHQGRFACVVGLK